MNTSVRKSSLVGVVWVLLGLSLVSAPVWALPVARLRNVKPEVQVSSGGAFAVARERTSIRYGDIVRTAKNGKVELLFTNGTRVAMRENSQIQLIAPQQKDSPMVIRVFGALSEVFVRPRGNTQVRTAAAIAAARGTAFLVRLPDENSAEVTVTEDEVDFFNDKGRVLLAAGQQSTAHVGMAPSPPVAVDASGLASWTAEITGLPVEFETPFSTLDQNAARQLVKQREAGLNSAADLVAARRALGEAQYDAGDYSQAVEQFDRVIKAHPNDARAWYGMGQARRGQGDSAGAIAAYQQALQLDPNAADAHLGLALAHLSQSNFEAATAAGGSSDTIAGLIALHRGDYTGAEKLLRSAVAGAPNSYQAQSLLALSLISQNKPEAARAAAQRAVQLEPRSAQAQGTLGMVLFFSGPSYTREALRTADKAVSLNPDSPFALLVLGRASLADGDIDEARDAFSEAAALSPGLEITHTELAGAWLRQGHIASAEKEYRRALAINPNSATAQSGLAQVLAATGKNAEARAAFEKAIAQNGGDASARAAYAAYLIEDGKLDEAQKQLEQGVIAAPERGILYARLSEVSLMHQKLKEAEIHARKAVGLLPDSSVAHYQLGRVYLEQDRLTQALQEFRVAVSLDRDNANARYALGYTRELVETGRDPSRPSASAQGGALNSGSRLTNLQNLQTPGAEDRFQALTQDPTVARTASRSYGDTEVQVLAGGNGTRNGEISHVELSDDKRSVTGVGVSRHSFDDINDRSNSDTTDDKANFLYGQKSSDSPSSFFATADYERLKEGLNKGDLPPVTAPSRNIAKKPRITLGGNWQKEAGSRTRFVLQYSKPESETVNPLFGDKQDFDARSFNAEVRHDHRIGRDHYLSLGAFDGKRSSDTTLFIAGFPPIFPDQFTFQDNDIRFRGAYIRDEYQANKKLTLTGEVKLLKLDVDNTISFDPPLTPTARIHLDEQKVLPYFMAEYRANSSTSFRFRGRRVFGGIFDFQLLSPKDVFLSPVNDLPALFITGDGTSFELEGDHTFSNGSFFRLGVFQQNLNDAQVPTADGSGAAISRSRLRGIRAGYEGAFSRDISYFINAAYTSAQDRSTNGQIPNVPRFTTEAGLQYLNGAGWFLQPSVYHQGSRERASGGQADGFTTFNFRAGKRFGLRAAVFVEVINVTDKEFDILEIDQPGRQFRVGINGRF